ncbi:MAG TPA: tRNA methyl transferase PRC-barrel domain-containing protein, partial [Elusimicrobiota bacterium]|nr:tRNA methyl transferase PRC-barrel domain-containing protein [Elusimicrobiota bacterium]
LYHLGQAQLAQLMFPIGDYAKPAIREIARKYNLRTADKPDSQEICFVPNNDYRSFLAEQIPESARAPGPIRHINGAVLGRHQGLPFYTVGQRSGLGVAVGQPLYVVGLEKESNTLVVGDKSDVLAGAMTVRDVRWVSGRAPRLPLRAHVKIRYKHQEAAAVLNDDGETSRHSDGEKNRSGLRPVSPSPRLHVVFDVPQSAVTPGQAAVFYDGDTVLGGGVIDHVIQS